MKIGVDAMGGDYAPEATVLGAIDALNYVSPDTHMVLFGDKSAIEQILEREKCPKDRFEVVGTTEVIEMGDHPAQAFTKKADSSITVGFKRLMGRQIDGFASAGNTGAMMVGTMYTIKPIEGVLRPAIASLIPVTTGGASLILDVGLNADCKPEVLYQYGVLGSIYAKAALGIQNPRVALLNIGEEPEKGNILTKATHELMAGTKDFNFVGNIEGKTLYTGETADVIICDGFVGNTVLKQTEGLYSALKKLGVKSEYTDRFNYEEVGGTPVLGINSNVIIGHGCSSAKAIKNMILQTEITIKANLVEKFKEAFC